jgi:hypothetical protein
MLDSLVRVSRRVGWSTDLIRHRQASCGGRERRDSLPVQPRARPLPEGSETRDTRGANTAPSPRCESSVPRRVSVPVGAIDRALTRRTAFGPPLTQPRDSTLPAKEPVVALDRPEQVHPLRRQQVLPRSPSPWRAGRAEGRQGAPDASGLNAPGRATLRLHPFDSVRFHVLLNSLFKVLFNFPSRYLSTIGLVSSI